MIDMKRYRRGEIRKEEKREREIQEENKRKSQDWNQGCKDPVWGSESWCLFQSSTVLMRLPVLCAR